MIWLHSYRVMDEFGMLNDKIITPSSYYHSAVLLSKTRGFIIIPKNSVTVNLLFKCYLFTCLKIGRKEIENEAHCKGISD